MPAGGLLFSDAKADKPSSEKEVPSKQRHEQSIMYRLIFDPEKEDKINQHSNTARKKKILFPDHRPILFV
ncbi:hypothetical protein [Faecalispora sporosphaeroides]|uniref:hypothetical protein n=1 Tax=Faecalispora sporosphaeroides TaxID=1549 RepID=UPI0015A69DE9|nr:hypothetical protein [Faecalispora sporosphaeroides]